MKGLLLTAAIMLASTTVANAAIPNIYACGLSHIMDNDRHTFTYTLNADATAVDILVYDIEGNLVETIASDGLSQGINTFTTEIKSTGTLTWAVKATAPANEGSAPILLANKSDIGPYPSDADLDWTRVRGIDVNTDFRSQNFGKIYIGSAARALDSQGYAGIEVFNSMMVPEKSSGCYNGGQIWRTQSSPNDVFVAEDGNIYLADWSDAHSGVYMADGADLDADFAAVFSGTRSNDGVITNADGISVGGSCVTCCTKGSGEDLALYTFDEDLDDGGLCRYNLASSTLPWATVPSAELGRSYTIDGTTVTLDAGATVRLRPDMHGGLWLCYRSDAEGHPGLLHFNANDEADYHLGVSSTGRAGLAVNRDGSMLAVAGDNGIQFFNVTFDENDIPVAVPAEELTISYSSPQFWGLAFDYAGNLYATQFGTTLLVYAMPKAENTCEVPGTDYFRDGVVVGVTDVESVVDDTAVAIYTIAGICVGDDISVLPSGVYIVRSATEVYKIVK